MSISVSIVEDDSQIRQLLTDWIRKSPDMTFGKAYPDAESALEDLPRNPSDVVLTDINLPVLSGIESVRQLKLLLPATNFVMLTVYMDAEMIFQALAAGATGYMLKRASRDELLAAIREVHAGGSPMSSSIARLVVEAMRVKPAKDAEMEQLTDRELDVLRLLARGMLYKEISADLSISFNTVHTLIRRIYDKLHVHTRRQAVERFQQMGRPSADRNKLYSRDALTSLKYFREEMPELALCCAGSHIRLAVSEGSFPVGQVDFLTLYPLSFEEFLGATDERAAAILLGFGSDTMIPEAIHLHLWEQLKLYYITGGLPEVVEHYRTHCENLPEALQSVRRMQRGLLQGYQSDFSKHAGKVNAVHINRVLEAVPDQMLRVVDGSVGRFRFKGVIPDRSKFAQLEGPIDWLVKTGLVIKTNLVEKSELPLRAYSKSNLFKLYLFDVGMLGCMLDLPLDSILSQDYGTYKGYYAENFVAQEFNASGKAPLYSWCGRQSEVEFLIIRGSDIIPVEVKSGVRAHSRSLSAYAEKYKPQLRLKITARNLDRSSADCHNIPLYLAGKI